MTNKANLQFIEYKINYKTHLKSITHWVRSEKQHEIPDFVMQDTKSIQFLGKSSPKTCTAKNVILSDDVLVLMFLNKNSK